MVLNDEQCGRFFDAMDALLLYVNDRFQVVEGFSLDYTGQIGDLKTSLVAQTLWENVEIIDEFVRENPFGLSQRCLDTARAWKVALPGLYAVVRYQNGHALLMNDLGVFSVSGVTNEIEQEIGKAPAYVHIVLLPFDDVIIYDGFLQAYDVEGTQEEATHIQDEFENHCAQGIIATADEFTATVGAYLAAKRDDEIEALLADVAREAAGEEEELPEGFHRGALVGLEGFERENAIAAEMKLREESHPGNQREQGLEGHGLSSETGKARNRVEIQQDQAMNCAIACVLQRGVVELDDAYDQYQALAPDPLSRDDFRMLAHHEASFSDSYFGIWAHDGREYLTYYSLTPDYLTQTASRENRWDTLKSDLAYYESYKIGLLEARVEAPPRPLSRTLLENTPLGELLGNPCVVQLRRFIDERIPDGQDDYQFADLAVQEFVLVSVESGNPDEVFRLCDSLGLTQSTSDAERLNRLCANVFNAMPSWENNGWSPQELYEQLTGRRIFFNEDGTVMRLAGDDLCPCGSGKPYRNCCGR